MDTNDILGLQETVRIKEALRVAAYDAASTACTAAQSAATAASATICTITVNTSYKLSQIVSLTPNTLAAASKATNLEEDRLAALASYEAASKNFMILYELNKANSDNYDTTKAATTTYNVAYEVLVKSLSALVEATANALAAEEEAVEAFNSFAEA